MGGITVFDAPGTDEPDGSRLLHWPIGFSPDFSDLWAAGEIGIDADPATVFAHLAGIRAWARDFTGPADGPTALRAESEFVYRLDGLAVHARVGEYSPGSRLAWFGQGIDFGLYQEWLLLDHGDRTLVLLGLAARGSAAIARRESDPAGARRCVDRWLSGLKTRTEDSA
ncbi:hypothetical protein [Streptomyces sp. NPDC052721]|uniref:hypothetical protein n=1 Tax=Streptomyces sp. NPDC052721 TaxID=3154955 RepID=UPI0034249049